MLTLVIYLLPLVLTFRYWNLHRVKNVKLNAQNELEQLRFKLRMLCIQGKVIREQNIIYDLLDSAITNSEEILERASFWHLLYTTYRNKKKEQKPIEHIKLMEEALANQAELNEIYNEYILVTYRYFTRKSLFSIVITGIVRSTFQYFSRRLYRSVINCKNNIKYHLLAFMFPSI